MTPAFTRTPVRATGWLAVVTAISFLFRHDHGVYLAAIDIEHFLPVLMTFGVHTGRLTMEDVARVGAGLEGMGYAADCLEVRLVQFVTGMGNIRDVIPFPRTPRNLEF